MHRRRAHIQREQGACGRGNRNLGAGCLRFSSLLTTGSPCLSHPAHRDRAFFIATAVFRFHNYFYSSYFSFLPYLLLRPLLHIPPSFFSSVSSLVLIFFFSFYSSLLSSMFLFFVFSHSSFFFCSSCSSFLLLIFFLLLFPYSSCYYHSLFFDFIHSSFFFFCSSYSSFLLLLIFFLFLIHLLFPLFLSPDTESSPCLGLCNP